MQHGDPRTRLGWDDVQLFLEIARAGTLTAAATRLRLSQPTAGRRLRALEARLGTPLFQRTPHGFRLTDEGEAMLLHAERMEEEAVALERKLGGSDRGLHGQLRLSCSEWFGRQVLAPALASFALAHPALSVELIADSRLLDLERREADLGFRFVPFAGADIVQRRFTQIRYGLFAAADYIVRFGMPKADGAGHRLVAMDSAYDALPDMAWLRARWPAARFSVRSNSRDVQAEACAAGAGLAVLPLVIGAAAGLTLLDLADPPPGREIWIGYHADLRRLARLRSLIDHLDAAIPHAI
jgi:DNA-binding transcriptional LysR family regulator